MCLRDEHPVALDDLRRGYVRVRLGTALVWLLAEADVIDALEDQHPASPRLTENIAAHPRQGAGAEARGGAQDAVAVDALVNHPGRPAEIGRASCRERV